MITVKGPIGWVKVATPRLRDPTVNKGFKGMLVPYHPCMAYLPTFGLNFWLKFMVNVGKYTIHGSYGYGLPMFRAMLVFGLFFSPSQT